MSVAHAMGGIDGRLYTNTREAFLQNYSRGFRVFELDLAMTTDSALVLAHDWYTGSRQGLVGRPDACRVPSARLRSPHPAHGRRRPPPAPRPS